MSRKAILKYGIMCSGYEFEQWEANCIENLLSFNQAKLSLLIINDNEPIKQIGIFNKIIDYPYRKLFFRFYKRYFLNPISYQRFNLEHQLKPVSVIKCKTKIVGKYAEYFFDSDVEQIKEHQLDFILRFSFNIIKGSILDSCKYGVWSFHHADPRYIRGGPIGFWEIYNKRDVAGSILQRLNEKIDQGKVLRKGYLKTIDHSYSSQIDQLAEMSAQWPKQVCIDILNGVEVEEKFNAIDFTESKLYRYPNNLQFVKFLFLLLANKIKFHYIQLFCAEFWNVAVLQGSVENFKDKKVVRVFENLPNSYLADPFLFEHNGKPLIAVEHYSYLSRKGKIEVYNLEGERIKEISTGSKFHLSYPYIILFEGRRFVIPECAEDGHVLLFELNLEHEVIHTYTLLKDVAVRDSSIVFYENKWWLFCTAAGEFENSELHIYYSDSLFTPFKAHKNNPVKVDIQNGRPGGNLFLKDGKLYRPAQNSAKYYGEKLVINCVTTLSEIAFEEHLEKTIEASDFGTYKGIHHLSIYGDYMVVDLKSHAFNWLNFSFELKRKFAWFTSH